MHTFANKLKLFVAVATTSLIMAASTDANTTYLFRGHSAAYWHYRFTSERKNSKIRVKNLRHKIRYIINSPSNGKQFLEKAFLCIHSHEASWTDPNAPYYGGLQMDMTFMRDYGSEYLRYFGTANNWPISVQIAVAINAYKSGRGFYPWPITARMCGLLP